MPVGFKGSSPLVSPRDDIGLAFDEIDLEAVRGGYVGLQIAPIAEANLKFGTFRKMKLEQLLQPRNVSREANGGFKRIDADFEVDSYKVEDYGVEMRVDYSDAAAFSGLIDSEMTAAELTRHSVLEAHEMRVIAVVNALTPGATVGSGNKFTDPTSPLTTNFIGYKQTFRLQCGMSPNALCVDSEIIDYMLENASVQDKFAGADDRTARKLALSGLAAALGIDEVIESNAVKNTKTGNQARTLASMWPRQKALLFRKSNGTVVMPQFMRTIHWSGNGSRPGCVFEQYEEPQTDGTVLRHRMDTQEKVIYTECAMVLDTIAS